MTSIILLVMGIVIGVPLGGDVVTLSSCWSHGGGGGVAVPSR